MISKISMETTTADPGKRRTLAGYVVVDVNVRRRNLFKNVDAFLIVENALDRRYRAINISAYTNAEELIGSPQNPRRITIGLGSASQVTFIRTSDGATAPNAAYRP